MLYYFQMFSILFCQAFYVKPSILRYIQPVCLQSIFMEMEKGIGDMHFGSHWEVCLASYAKRADA